jgi:mitochondrial fission protein ELM1
VLCDGRIGIANEVIGLAEAVGLPFRVKELRPRAPWRWLPESLWPWDFAPLDHQSDHIAPPWPDLLIGAGGRTAGIAAAIRRKAQGKTFAVHLQDPRIALDNFDLVVPPWHDRISGPNVIETVGALHRVTPTKTEASLKELAPRIAHLPRPHVAVLIGGSNGSYRLNAAEAGAIAGRLAALVKRTGCSLLVTFSRRTGEKAEAAFRAALGPAPALIWDDEGENPYFGFLGDADFILVTIDSVAMVSEALSTGKPVYTLALPGRNDRIRAFHHRLGKEGLIRPFADRLEIWTYKPLNDTGMVAAIIRQRLGLVP